MKQHLTVVQMYGELPRDRRLLEGEEAKILEAAPPRIRDLIIAALETGCRMGELSGLQWFQVRWDLNEVHLRLKATKGKKPRALPMSQRLRAVLELRRHAPDGELHPPQAFVFGNEVGERIKDPKKAWETTLLKAYGYEIRHTKTGALTPELRQALRTIDLHRHDLRREAGSSLMEHGMPGRYVQEFLDHANLSTTSRYLKGTQSGLHAALKAVEERRARTNCKNLQDPELASDGPAAANKPEPFTKQ